MPIGFDPNDTCTVHLNSVDGGKPDDQRAKFTCRFLTSGEVKKVERLRNQALSSPSTVETDRLLNEAIRIGIVGWTGLVGSDGKPIVYAGAPAVPPTVPDSEPPYDVLDEFTQRLKFQVVAEYPSAILLSNPEKKA